MDGKRNGLVCILTGIATGALMLLLLYAACPFFDTDLYMLFFKGAGKGTAALFMLFLPPLIPLAVSIISLIKKDGQTDALMNILLAGILAFIIQLLYVLLLLQ